jgi:hypothetical protein
VSTVALSELACSVMDRWRAVRAMSAGRRSRLPGAAVMAAAPVVVVGALTRPLTGTLTAATAHRWGWSADLVGAGELWRIGTAVPLTRDPFMLVSTVASVLVAVGALERLAGHARAIVTMTAGAIAGYVGVTAAVLALRAVGVGAAARWATTVDYGASAGVAACAGAIVGMLRLWPVTTGMVLFILGGLLLHHQVADWEHATAFTLSAVLSRTPRRRSGECSA